MRAYFKDRFVKTESRYSIDFKGLENGNHQFLFEIDDTFFEQYPESDVKKGKVQVKVGLQKHSFFLRLTFKFEGVIELQCDRCLDYYDYPIALETELNVKFGDEDSDLSDADTEITLANTALEIVLDKHFFDYVNLCVPAQKIHPEDKNGHTTCNPDMLDLIRQHNPPEEETTEIDPRWEKLKTLMN